jgi:hypothetical protein
VTEAIKGNVGVGGLVKVVIPGGKITFPDGASAETTTAHLEPLKPGSRYVLFLAPIDRSGQSADIAAEERGGYILKLGSQGIFELSPNGVKAHGREIDVVTRDNNGVSTNTFLEKVRRAKNVPTKPAK